MSEFLDKEELRKMISRYMEGEATPEEIIFLKKYYSYFENFGDGLEMMTDEEQNRLKTKLFNKIRTKVHSKKKQRSLLIYVQAAAAVALIVMGFFVFRPSGDISEQESIRTDIVIKNVPWVYDTATSGEKHIYLPDGSYVQMDEGTTIGYRKDFCGNLREVKLSGSAFFDVQRDSVRPFIVWSDSVSTTVLGTSFAISSPERSDDFSITVTEGKVEVASGPAMAPEVLGKNDQLMLNKKTHKRTKTKLHEEKAAQFVPSEYIMDDMTVFGAIEIVEKWWDCTIRIGNPDMKNCRFTTSFVPTDELEVVIAVISGVIGADYEIKGRAVTLMGEGCR